MHYLVILLLALCFAMVGCSDDTDKPVDAGIDAVMEASVDAAPPVEASVDAAQVTEASVDAAPADVTPMVEAAIGD